MMTSLSFSQTDTTKILLNKSVAKLVIKDLIKYDGLVVENQIKDSIIFENIEKSLDQIKIINDQKQIIYNLNKQYENSHQQYLQEYQNSKYYFDQWNKQKKTTYIVGGSGILLTLLTIFILK